MAATPRANLYPAGCPPLTSPSLCMGLPDAAPPSCARQPTAVSGMSPCKTVFPPRMDPHECAPAASTPGPGLTLAAHSPATQTTPPSSPIDLTYSPMDTPDLGFSPEGLTPGGTPSEPDEATDIQTGNLPAPLAIPPLELPEPPPSLREMLRQRAALQGGGGSMAVSGGGSLAAGRNMGEAGSTGGTATSATQHSMPSALMAAQCSQLAALSAAYDAISCAELLSCHRDPHPPISGPCGSGQQLLPSLARMLM